MKPQKPTVGLDTDASEQVAILQKVPEQHKTIFTFMFETGCRPQEARALLWSDLDFENDTVTVRHAFSGNVHRRITKGKKERVLPLSATLKQALLKHHKVLRSEFVFHTRYGKPLGENRLRKIWDKACTDAEITGIKLYGGTRHSFHSHKN